MRPYRCVGWLLLCAPSTAALAGDFYKCVGPEGQVSIQSDACAAGWTQAWKRDATAELPPTAEQQQALVQRRERERAEAEALSRLAGTAKLAPADAAEAGVAAAKPAKPAPARPPVNACRDAHAFADAVRSKDFLELSNYQLSRLSEWVAGQCRDPD